MTKLTSTIRRVVDTPEGKYVVELSPRGVFIRQHRARSGGSFTAWGTVHQRALINDKPRAPKRIRRSVV